MIAIDDMHQQTQPFIINGWNQQLVHSQVIGTLSIKCMFNGSAVYGVEGSHLRVDDTRYLMLNHAQPYDMWIDAPTLVESFCVFFPRAWSIDVLRNLTLTDEMLLDNPYDNEQPVLFFELPHYHDHIVTPILKQLRQLYQQTKGQSSIPDSLFYGLLAGMLDRQRGIHHQAEAFPAVRYTTRQELYRRLHLAREFLMANLHHSISLDDLARIAIMSPYHFLRRFTDMFDMTPHAYLTQHRLQHAKQLLITSHLSITEICIQSGFRSLGSFSTLFRKTYGVSPRLYRQTHQPIQNRNL